MGFLNLPMRKEQIDNNANKAVKPSQMFISKRRKSKHIAELNAKNIPRSIQKDLFPFSYFDSSGVWRFWDACPPEIPPFSSLTLGLEGADLELMPLRRSGKAKPKITAIPNIISGSVSLCTM